MDETWEQPPLFDLDEEIHRVYTDRTKEAAENGWLLPEDDSTELW